LSNWADVQRVVERDGVLLTLAGWDIKGRATLASIVRANAAIEGSIRATLARARLARANWETEWVSKNLLDKGSAARGVRRVIDLDGHIGCERSGRGRLSRGSGTVADCVETSDWVRRTKANRKLGSAASGASRIRANRSIERAVAIARASPVLANTKLHTEWIRKNIRLEQSTRARSVG